MISTPMGRRPIGVEIMGRIAQIADTSRTKIAGASSLAVSSAASGNFNRSARSAILLFSV
jgi:hypothetical protein